MTLIFVHSDWATDRIDDQGVIAFITNNGWIDGNTGAGVRLSLWMISVIFMCITFGGVW